MSWSFRRWTTVAAGGTTIVDKPRSPRVAAVKGGPDESLHDCVSRAAGDPGACSTNRARNRLRFRAGFPEASAEHELRRGSGCGGELQGAHVRVYALEQRYRFRL